MATFENLLNPTSFNLTLTIITVSLLFMVSFIGIKLRSLVTIVMFAINVMVLLFIILVGLEFIWFWISIFGSAIVICIVAIVTYKP